MSLGNAVDHQRARSTPSHPKHHPINMRKNGTALHDRNLMRPCWMSSLEVLFTGLFSSWVKSQLYPWRSHHHRLHLSMLHFISIRQRGLQQANTPPPPPPPAPGVTVCTFPCIFFFFFLIHRSHSISFTRAQGIPKYKIGFGRFPSKNIDAAHTHTHTHTAPGVSSPLVPGCCPRICGSR
jgi:hypothetical protein